MTRIVPRGGHFPGHVRDAFLDAIEAFTAWKDGDPEQAVEMEHHYEPHPVSLSTMCGLLWNCTDVLPGSAFDALADALDGFDIDMRRRTYAVAARSMREAIATAIHR
jgi:hypothetical protein